MDSSNCAMSLLTHSHPGNQETLRGAVGDSSLNTSPGKGGEREVNCWNCDGPLTPTHQCEEVVNYSEFKDCDKGARTESCYYNPADIDPCGKCPACLGENSSSDASDIAQRCPECPECSPERHNALFREK